MIVASSPSHWFIIVIWVLQVLFPLCSVLLGKKEPGVIFKQCHFKDPVLARVQEYMLRGGGAANKGGLCTIHGEGDELSVQDGCVLWEAFPWVAAAPVAAAPSAPPLPPAPGPSNELWLSAPECYNGDPGKYQSFLSTFLLIFGLQPSSFPTERSKVAYVITRATYTSPWPWRGFLIILHLGWRPRCSYSRSARAPVLSLIMQFFSALCLPLPDYERGSSTLPSTMGWRTKSWMSSAPATSPCRLMDWLTWS